MLSFRDVIDNVNALQNSEERTRVIEEFLARSRAPVVEGGRVYFVYRGDARTVALPCELNQWNPSRSPMERIAGTDFFYRAETIPADGRIEYKIFVDDRWITDPMNPRPATTGRELNSEILMPGYRADEGFYRPGGAPQRRDALELLWFESKCLRRTHPVFYYTPPLPREEWRDLPVLLVHDGGEYLEYARLHEMLDALILAGAIVPLLAVCADPRTNLADAGSSRRMTDYAASQAFLDFVERELFPFTARRYPVSQRPEDRAALGASMGGLIATYMAVTRGHFMPRCAAQSPAYLYADGAVIKAVDAQEAITATVMIQTGTINDTAIESRLVARALTGRGAELIYEEYNEGHNWTFWRSRLPRILLRLFGTSPSRSPG